MAPKPTKTSTVAGKGPAGKSPADKEAGKKTVSGTVTKKKKKTASKTGRWQRYITALLKQVHPDTTISTRSVSILNSMIDDLLDRLCRECATLIDMGKQVTLKSRVAQSATLLVLPGELAKHATAEAKSAVTKAMVYSA